MSVPEPDGEGERPTEVSPPPVATPSASAPIPPSPMPQDDVADDPMARTILSPAPRAARPVPSLDEGRATRVEPAIAAPPRSLPGGLDEPTMEFRTQKREVVEAPPESGTAPPVGGLRGLRDGLRAFFHRHERVLWWLHTAYALGLGFFVATFAQKGFERARWLAVSLALAWMLVAVFFRFFGTGARQDFLTAWPGARRRFFVMTYLMKNLFQGMLFFLLPFYWRAASLEAGTAGPLVLVAGCAVVSTLDLVVDRFLFRWKVMASGFYAVTLFGCLQVVIPALFEGTRTLVTLSVSGGLTVAAFLLFHLPLSTLRRPAVLAIFLALVGGGALGAYGLRGAIPAVPMFVREGGVGPALAADGALALDVRGFRAGTLADVWAVTDVAVIGEGEALVHVWRHRGRIVAGSSAPLLSHPGKGTLRVSSYLPRGAWPADPTGAWSVDARTAGGQTVGRTTFVVRP